MPPVSFACWSLNCKFILAASLDQVIRLWRCEHKDTCVKTYRGHVNRKYCIPSLFTTQHPPRQYLISGSESGTIEIFDVNTQEIVSTIRQPEEAENQTRPQSNGMITKDEKKNGSNDVAINPNTTPAHVTSPTPSPSPPNHAPIIALCQHPTQAILASANMTPPFYINIWKANAVPPKK